MKRTPKPFSVEIKKSRVQGQSHPLPPRRLFDTLPAEATKIFQKEEPHAATEPAAAPRILPSILEPMWSASEAVEPVCRKRTLRADQSQTELALKAVASEAGEDGPAEAAGSSKAVPQMDGEPAIQEDPMPAHESQPREAGGAKSKSRQPRKKAPQAAEQVMAFEPMLELEQALEAGVIEPSPPVIGPKSGHHRLTKRRAAAAQLPRSDRWKRRLHPAAW